MRVLHIVPTDIGGGADKGSYGLHRALRARGVESQMLVLRKFGDDPSVIPLRHKHAKIVEGLRDTLDRVPLWFYRWTRKNWWTTGWLPFDIMRSVEKLKPDVVNLHWTGRGLTPISMLPELAKYKIVWTLRDMWPFTGGCHYTSGCEGFQSGCGRCPQLTSKSRFDISSWQWKRKQKAWRGVPLTYVAMSRWMAEAARSAPLVNGNEVALIPNGIDVSRYRPADKAACRRMWDLPADRPVILFGAMQADKDPRKGMHHLMRALSILESNGWGDRAVVAVFGTEQIDLPTKMVSKCVGYLHDHFSLAALYAAADVMVTPAEEENMGKTALEALACGTPVVAFANTGQLDIIDHKINGYLARNLSPEDLAAGIEWCLERAAEGDSMRIAARLKAERCFDINGIAEAYNELYERLLSEQPTAGAQRIGNEVPPSDRGPFPMPGFPHHPAFAGNPFSSKSQDPNRDGAP